MGILAWILLGLVVGVLAKWILSGDDPGGFVITVSIGIAGAVVGGFIASRLGLGSVTGFDLGSLAIAVGGSLLLRVLYRKLRTWRACFRCASGASMRGPWQRDLASLRASFARRSTRSTASMQNSARACARV